MSRIRKTRLYTELVDAIRHLYTSDSSCLDTNIDKQMCKAIDLFLLMEKPPSQHAEHAKKRVIVCDDLVYTL